MTALDDETPASTGVSVIDTNAPAASTRFYRALSNSHKERAGFRAIALFIQGRARRTAVKLALLGL